jgi:DNA-binding transcriptional MerR regulator
MAGGDEEEAAPDGDVYWLEAKDSKRVPPTGSMEFTIGQLAKDLGVTPRALRYYERRGLISPRRDGRRRAYSLVDRDRVLLILKGKRLGFTIAEIARMIEAVEAGTSAQGLRLSLAKCDEQIEFFNRQLRHAMEALVELWGIRITLRNKAGKDDPPAD